MCKCNRRHRRKTDQASIPYTYRILHRVPSVYEAAGQQRLVGSFHPTQSLRVITNSIGVNWAFDLTYLARNARYWPENLSMQRISRVSFRGMCRARRIIVYINFISIATGRTGGFRNGGDCVDDHRFPKYLLKKQRTPFIRRYCKTICKSINKARSRGRI